MSLDCRSHLALRGVWGGDTSQAVIPHHHRADGNSWRLCKALGVLQALGALRLPTGSGAHCKAGHEHVSVGEMVRMAISSWLVYGAV